jgi:PKD repeat protein
MRSYLIIWIILLISVHPSLCNEIAYAFGPDGFKPVGQANLTDYKGTDKVAFTVSAAPKGPVTSYQSTRTVDSIKQEIDYKVDKGNELVRNEGLRLIGNKSGPQRIDQICSIYDYMVGNWIFVSDWSGLEAFQYSNYTLRMGNEVGSSGKGDCDDFSILLASLIESIGGTPQIIFAYSPTGGHAYTEVYLGKSSNKETERMLRWLRSSYSANDVNVHVDPGNGDLWLNMDWWKDSGGATHPGGPFYKATVQIPVYNLDTKAPLTPIENLLPIALFNYSPLQPEVEEWVSFDASESIDPDGQIVDYQWDFGDGETAHGISKSVCRHGYYSSGKFPVNLTVTDNERDKSTKTLEINVEEPLPTAVGTYTPINPEVGDVITFDGSQSKDKRGRIIDYEWNFDDGYSGERVSIDHQYLKSGTYSVKLTVTNDKGTKNSSIIKLDVSPKIEPTSTSIPATYPVDETIPTAAVYHVNETTGAKSLLLGGNRLA